MDEKQDLVDSLASVSLLSALDPGEVDSLTPQQRRFLLAFINSGSVSAARKQTQIKLTTWKRWLEEEAFKRVFDIVKSPPAFAYNLFQSILLRAAVRHLQLLNHPRVDHQKWAIERAYNLLDALKLNQRKEEEQRQLTYEEAKAIAAAVAGELGTPRRHTPFEVIENDSGSGPT